MTTEPNELAATVHDRMPVMLHAREVARWLDLIIKDPDEILDLLGPYPADDMASRPVSKRVSNPDNEGPEAVLCANCHAMLHAYPTREMSVESLRRRLKQARDG